VALVHLVARLRLGGFSLLDTQFVTAHLAQFGAVELPRRDYKHLLHAALERYGEWYVWPADEIVSGADALSVIEQA
jgi:leucyl/phenylalanyl-tRNA--protein transferase